MKLLDINKIHSTDILTMVSSLSSDEKFTPPNIANKMLDLLPSDLWNNHEIKFLDPFSKTGVFLREITSRLIDGLEEKFPDLEERINHILRHQVFGLGITELTSLISRRSLYCSKYANGKYSIISFDDKEGNIKFPETNHSWTVTTGKCAYCGVSKQIWERSVELQSYAYPFIHTEDIREFFDMKFDVIVGNPPYHMKDGGGKGDDSAKPIYNLFVEQAVKLNPSYISMIIPSKWMKGGKGLKPFRNQMMEDKRIKFLYDFEDEKECFEGINLAGGVCYFLWDKNYEGKVEYVYKPSSEEPITSKRFLKDDFSETIIRDMRQISIIKKVNILSKNNFSEIVSTRKPYGISTNLFNNPEKYGYENIPDKPFKNSLKVYGVKGHKGGSKRVTGYIAQDDIYHDDSIKKYKLFMSYAYSHNSTVPPELILGKPNEICTETFLQIGPFDTEEEAKNCLKYIKSKFFRALLFYNRIQQNISKDTFNLIPLIKFTKNISDTSLYKKYGLTSKEVSFIEENIKEMA